MVAYSSNGDIIVQQKNDIACQYLEYYALSVIQYCKETMKRDKRLYDLRGIVISNMANDLKDFVKGYVERKDKKKNYEQNLTASFIENVVEALSVFGSVYNSGSFKKYSEVLKNEFPQVFLYKDIIQKLVTELKRSNFIVLRSESASTSSVYFDIDYKNLMSIRVSDHYKESFDGIQIIFCKTKHEKAGSNYVYCIREDYFTHDLNSVTSFVIQNLRYQKQQIANKQYLELVQNSKTLYKDENSRYQEVE